MKKKHERLAVNFAPATLMNIYLHSPTAYSWHPSLCFTAPPSLPLAYMHLLINDVASTYSTDCIKYDTGGCHTQQEGKVTSVPL